MKVRESLCQCDLHALVACSGRREIKRSAVVQWELMRDATSAAKGQGQC